jgi:streptogramin lyase
MLLNKPAVLPRGPNTVAAYGSSGGEPPRGIVIDRGPTALAFGDGVAWSANTDAGTVSRINWSSGLVTGIGQAGRRPSDVALTPGRAWVVDRYSNQVALIEAGQGALIDTFAIHASAIAAEENQVWLADDLNDRIVRLDPLSGAVLASIDLPSPAGPTDIAVVGGAVWIAAPRNNAVLRLDAGGAAVADLGLPLDDVRTVTGLGKDVWLASPSTDIVARLDASTGRIATQVEVCDTPIAIAATPTGAWVACALDRQLWRLDLAGTVTVKITLDAVPSALAADGELALVTLRAD